MIGHFSAEELASYRAGAIDADRAARISAHLADCARCAGVDSDLAEVSVLLAGIPAPPMPDRLTERVQAAIAAESQRRVAGVVEDAGAGAGAGAEPVNVPGRPDLPERSHRRRASSRRSFWTSPLVLGGLAATGVFAFIVVGAAVAFNHIGVSGSASAPGSAQAVPKSLSKSAPGRVNGVGAPNESLGTRPGIQITYRKAAHEATATALATDAHYTRGNLDRGIRTVISHSVDFSSAYGMPVVPSPGSTHKAPDKVGSVGVGRIAGCLAAVAPSGGVLVVEVAHYLGKPAMIIVGKPVGGTYQVAVAGLACSASRPDVLARITVPKTR